MAVLGETGKPGYSYFAYDGTANPNQVAELLYTAERIQINTLAAWIGGWNDTVHAKLQVWDAATYAVLATTAEFVVANEGSAANGNVSLYEVDLVTPLIIPAATDFYVGVTKDRDDAAQWSTGTNINDHFECRAAYSDSATLGAVSGPPTVTARRTGMYVADYQLAVSGKIYRDGIWEDAGAVKVYRSGVWTDVDAVKVYRSGAWTDVG
jgi:hypothetical protein